MKNPDRSHVCRTAADVPVEPFFVDYVGYREPTIADWEQLATLSGLHNVGAGHAAGRMVAGGIQAILPATNLTMLNTGATIISAEEMAMLTSFKKLNSLFMALADDQAVATVAKLPHLANLRINRGSQVTDSCLKPLVSARQMDQLLIDSGVSISREAAVAFAAARPDVMVDWQGEMITAPDGLGDLSGSGTAPQ